MATTADGALAASDVTNPTGALVGGAQLDATGLNSDGSVILPHSSTDPASWLPAFLYFMQNGANFGSWNYVGLSLLLQASGAYTGSGANGEWVGVGVQADPTAAPSASPSSVLSDANAAGDPTSAGAAILDEATDSSIGYAAQLFDAAGHVWPTDLNSSPPSATASGGALPAIFPVGVQEPTTPFVYQDAQGVDAWLGVAQTGAGGGTAGEIPLFTEWATLLDPNASSGQSLFGALDPTAGTTGAVLAASDLTQGQLAGATQQAGSI